MKMPSVRFIATSLTFLAVLILSVWLLMTQNGLRWLVDTAKPYLPAEIRLGEFRGNLVDVIEVSEVVWRTDGMEIKISSVQLDCNWLAFLNQNYQCQLLSSKMVNVKTPASDAPDDDATLDALVRLQPIRSLHRANITELKIHQLKLQKQLATATETSAVIDDIGISNFTWSEDRFNWQEAKARSGPLSVSVKGTITTLTNWPVQLEASIALDENHINVSAKGDIFANSDWKITSHGQLTSTTSASLMFREGQPLLRADIEAPAQDLSWLQPSLALSHARIPVTLDWLKGDLGLDASLIFDGQEIKITNQLIAENILSWQSNLRGNASISSQLTPGKVNEYIATLSGNNVAPIKIPNQPQQQIIATTLNSTYVFEQGNLVADNQFAFGNMLQSQVRMQADVIERLYENLSISGSLSIPELSDTLDLTVTQLSSEFSLQQANPNARMKYLVSGKADKVAHQSAVLDQLTWRVDLATGIKGYVKVKQGKLAFDSSDIELQQFSLHVDGSHEAHSITLNSAINDMNLEMTSQGAIPELGDKLYQVNNLSLLLAKMERQINISAAELNVLKDGFQLENLCLNDMGRICGSVTKAADKLQAHARVEEFSTTQFLQWRNELGFGVPVSIDGLISGKLKLEQTADQIQTLDVSLVSPELVILSGDHKVWMEDLRLSSAKLPNATGLDIQWALLNSELRDGIKKVSFVSVQGNVRAELSELDDIRVNLKMPDNLLSMTGLLPDDADQTDITPSDKGVTISIPEIAMSGRYHNDKLHAVTSIDLLNTDHLRVDVSTSLPLTAQSEVDAVLDISLTQFDWLRNWQSRINDIDLVWQQTSRISGSLNKLSVMGDGKLQVNHFAIDEMGLEVKDSLLTIRAENNKVVLDGNLKNKQGEVVFNSDLILWPDIIMHASVTGDHLTVIDNTQHKLVLSPKIDAHYSDDNLTVTGDLVFNEANITMNKLPVTSVNVSEDEVYLGQQAEQEKSFDYDISLNLSGENVTFNGFGLSSQLLGRLQLHAQKGRTINLNGELKLIKGQFEAYKQVLTIEQGQLIFLGAANNPGIQFTATRSIDDIKVGVIADGTLLQPRLKLYSTPAMPEENILALMLTGRTLESLSESEGNALANAALSIGVEGANRIVQGIADSLGMKSIQISAKNTATTSSVNIQTQINDRLSAGYGTSIDSQNETQSGWIIEYRLSPKLSIEAISGAEVSANITYKNQFDSDKPKEKKAASRNN